ncbi:hypothetical protein BJ978_003266 [Agromyces terreus]|uniref:DUF3027 domain-containing protein n=1 Tax=Agromyces terreus TaxID=424795 RepID=A0A9X2H4D5_9MICO|nr:DUF3027 domain-containing protein [Agromyces terreus]MCP2372590.1 hypothetical protein [Agromyces terreus]
MPELPDSEIRADAPTDVEASAPVETLDADVTEAADATEAADPTEGADATDGAEATEVADAPAAHEPDPVLLASVDLARRALLETTAPETVGSVLGHVVEDEHVLTLHFASDLAGYPGWHWSVTLVRVEDAEPTIVETQLLPGERALLAPAWIPWSERLADYRAAQAAAAAAAREAADGHGEGDDLDDASEELEIVADDAFDNDADDHDDDDHDDDDHDVEVDDENDEDHDDDGLDGDHDDLDVDVDVDVDADDDAHDDLDVDDDRDD